MKLLKLGEPTKKVIQRWLPKLRRIVLSAGFMALVGSASGVIVVGIFQEPIEVEIQPPKETRPLNNVFGLEQDEFNRFPDQRRQVLATVASSPNRYHPMTIAVLSSLSLQSAELIRTLAAQVIEGKYLVRDNTASTRHKFVPSHMLSDFLDLETLGFLQAADTGLNVAMSTEDPRRSVYFNIIETTNYRILALTKDGKQNIELQVTGLTAAGQEIVSMLREPTDRNYVRWLVEQIRKQGFDVAVWSNWIDTKVANDSISTELGFPVYLDKELAEMELLPKYLLDSLQENGSLLENK